MINKENLFEILDKGSKEEKDAIYDDLIKRYNEPQYNKGHRELEEFIGQIDNIYSWKVLISLGNLHAINILLLSISHDFEGDRGPEILLEKIEIQTKHKFVAWFLKFADKLVDILKDGSYKKVFSDGDYVSFGDMLFQLAKYYFVRDLLQDSKKDLDKPEREIVDNIIKKAEKENIVPMRELHGRRGKKVEIKIKYSNIDYKKPIC